MATETAGVSGYRGYRARIPRVTPLPAHRCESGTGLRPEDQRRFRLAELAQRMGKAAYLIDDASDIQEAWVKDAACVGVTAGAPSRESV